MNKKEIYEYLKYDGIYDNDVKKRLKKLIKKFHPDKNKNDKKTILLLYEVKKELETKTPQSLNDKPPKKETQNKDISPTYAPFMKRMIEILKRKQELINTKIKRLNKKLHVFKTKRSKTNSQIKEVILNIEELEKEKLNLEKINIIDLLFVITVIFLTGLLITDYNAKWLIILMICLLLETIIIMFRVKRISIIIYEQSKLTEEKDDYNLIKKKYDNEIQKIEKECVELNFERNALGNDIQFYNYELSKILEDSYTVVKEQTKDTSYQKII